MTLTPIDDVRTKWHMDRVITFDIEAYDWVNPVAIGMANNRSSFYETFTGSNCIEDFVEEITRRKWRNYRFVAHNGGKYDFIPIIEELADFVNDRYGWDIQILTKGPNETPFFARIEDKNGKPRYLQDSLALMPRDLSSLTESFTPDLAKGDFDFNEIRPWEEMDKEKREEMMDYLKRDCRSLFQVLEEFTGVLIELTDGNCPPQLTVGSTAMAVYRSTFMEEGTSIPNCYKPENNDNPEEKFRQSYFGGRTEVYKKYGEDLYHYDVNSLYPYCYTTKPIPVGKVSHTGSGFPLENDKYGGVLKIKGKIPENAANGIPVLPYRHNPEGVIDERVVFPAGEIEGWYMAKEVRYAQEVGALENIEIKDSYMSKYGYPFKKYGEALYDLKKSIDKDKNPGKYKVVKFLLNSFYGKFGMDRHHKSVRIGNVTKEFMEGKEPITDGLTDKGIMLEEEESFAPYIIPRVASAITAQARIEMHKWFMRVFDRGGSIWYCDTDSIVTNVELPTGEELGEMDLEGTLSEGVYLAPKVYAEKYQEGDELIKAKGMRKPQMAFKDYREAYRENDPSMIGTSWESPRGFKAGMKSDGDGWFEVATQERNLRQFDQKRNHKDNRSIPLTL